jgi:hypothetical protein
MLVDEVIQASKRCGEIFRASQIPMHFGLPSDKGLQSGGGPWI